MNETKTANPKLKELQLMIAGAVASNPGKARVKALKACQWRMRGPGGKHVGMAGLRVAFVAEAAAMVFDGRDNEAMKLAYYESQLGPLTVEIIPQVTKATAGEVAALFGVPVEAVRSQYAKNAKQLRQLQATAGNRKHRGYTAEQFGSMADHAETQAK